MKNLAEPILKSLLVPTNLSASKAIFTQLAKFCTRVTIFNEVVKQDITNNFDELLPLYNCELNPNQHVF